jgi:hypothetical protein
MAHLKAYFKQFYLHFEHNAMDKLLKSLLIIWKSNKHQVGIMGIRGTFRIGFILQIIIPATPCSTAKNEGSLIY